MYIPIPFLPARNEEGAYLWKIDEIFDTAVDVTVTLEREGYVGAVNFRTGKAALAAAEVLVDGKIVGARRADGTALFGGLAVVFISKNLKLSIAPIILMLALFIFVPALNASTVGIMVPVGVLFTVAVARILYKNGIL